MPYEAQCRSFGQQIKENADKFYDPKIADTDKRIEEAKSAGKDPHSFEYANGIAKIDLVKLRQETVDAKGKAYLEAEERMNSCLGGATPDWLQDPQKITDFALAVAVLPYLAITQQYAAAKVDLGELYKGRILGGDDAFIPKLRDDVLNGLGVGGDVKKFALDPVNETKKAVENAVSAAGKAAQDLADKAKNTAEHIVNQIPGLGGVKL